MDAPAPVPVADLADLDTDVLCGECGALKRWRLRAVLTGCPECDVVVARLLAAAARLVR